MNRGKSVHVLKWSSYLPSLRRSVHSRERFNAPARSLAGHSYDAGKFFATGQSWDVHLSRKNTRSIGELAVPPAGKDNSLEQKDSRP
jgi:hypothetical protein